MLWALLQVFLITGFELLKPWPLQVVIDNVLGGKPFPIAALASSPTSSLLLFACLAMVVVHLGAGALTLLHNYTTIRVGQSMVNDVRSAIYAHLQRLSLAFHGRQRVGDLLYRITADSFAFQSMIMNGALPILSAAVLLAGMLLVLFPIDATLTLLALTVVPIAFRADFRVQPEDRHSRDRCAGHRKPGLFACPMDNVIDQGGPGLHKRGGRASPLYGREPGEPACDLAPL